MCRGGGCLELPAALEEGIKIATATISVLTPSTTNAGQPLMLPHEPAEVLAEEAGDERQRQEDGRDHRQLFHYDVEYPLSSR